MSQSSTMDPLLDDILKASNHRMPCTDEEIHQTACLNGGICFALPELNSRRAQCMCPSEWTGYRCEESYVDLKTLGNTGRSIVPQYTVAVLSVVCCLLLVMVFIMMVWILREKRKQNQADTLPKRQPLVHQISYSNYHGMRVIHSDSKEIPAECVLALTDNNFSTFVSDGQEAMSDYGSNNGINDSDMLTTSTHSDTKNTSSHKITMES